MVTSAITEDDFWK